MVYFNHINIIYSNINNQQKNFDIQIEFDKTEFINITLRDNLICKRFLI